MKGNNLMMKRKELASKFLLYSKKKEEKENEGMSFFKVLNLGEPGLVEERFPLLLHPLLEGNSTLPHEEGIIYLPLEAWQGIQFSQGISIY